jgi:hypothetical protein
LNTWAELRAADGTYTAIVEGDEEYGYKVIKKIDMRDKENNLIDEHILDLVLIIKVRSELTILEFSFERVGSRCVFFILGVM